MSNDEELMRVMRAAWWAWAAQEARLEAAEAEEEREYEEENLKEALRLAKEAWHAAGASPGGGGPIRRRGEPEGSQSGRVSDCCAAITPRHNP